MDLIKNSAKVSCESWLGKQLTAICLKKKKKKKKWQGQKGIEIKGMHHFTSLFIYLVYYNLRLCFKVV